MVLELSSLDLGKIATALALSLSAVSVATSPDERWPAIVALPAR
jgi:hypothetical protein